MRLWIAQGFGIGRIPFAPGTFGSLVGVAWFWLLVLTDHMWIYLLGTFVGLVLSVWLCGYGERVLGQKDPGSVVLDEIAAIPICFFPWIGVHTWKTGLFPNSEVFFLKMHWLAAAGIFAAFRLFDVWKPWPVRQSQVLPGGWGITVDDFLAALYVAVVVLAVALWRIQ